MVAKLGFFTGILKPIYNPFNGKKQLLIITINSQPRTLHLARDVMQLPVYLVPMLTIHSKDGNVYYNHPSPPIAL